MFLRVRNACDFRSIRFPVARGKKVGEVSLKLHWAYSVGN